MGRKRKPPVPQVLPRGIGPINEPNPNDVLCGRGGQVNEHSGNLRMRGLAVEVRDEYMAETTKKLEKVFIVNGVVREIRAMDPPGRFLKKDSETGLWWDIGDEQAWKKVAQALRESVPEKEEWEQLQGTGQLSSSLSAARFVSAYGPLMNGNGPAIPACYGPLQGSVLPSPTLQQGVYPFFQEQLHVSGLQTGTLPMETPRGLRLSAAAIALPAAGSLESPAPADEERYETQPKTRQKRSATMNEAPSNNCANQVSQASEGDVSDCLEIGQGEEDLFLSIFGEELDAPKFTEEEQERERKNMTEEERLAALSDVFGDLCEISQQKKKVARERSGLPAPMPLTIRSLLGEMRSEIEETPVEKKSAMVEALEKCSPSEFSDDRMDLFLRRENMNAKLAADRFVKYWERRRELFGPEKFHLRMSLSGALCDDNVALEAGVFSILPEPDASGRPILFYAPYRHKRDGYDRDSLLRAIWYVFEAVLEDGSAEQGVVLVTSWKHGTLWDYDRKLEECFAEMERCYLPFKFCAIHATGLSTLMVRFTKPVVFALMDKETRARLTVHHVVDDALLEALESYGISKAAVPAEMGGRSQYDHCEWLVKRRSAGN